MIRGKRRRLRHLHRCHHAEIGHVQRQIQRDNQQHTQDIVDRIYRRICRRLSQLADSNPNDPTCEAGSCGNTHYMLYEYTHNTIEGTTFFTANSPVGYASWPLPPGTYEIRMLLDDGFRLLAASAPFKVERK